MGQFYVFESLGGVGGVALWEGYEFGFERSDHVEGEFDGGQYCRFVYINFVSSGFSVPMICVESKFYVCVTTSVEESEGSSRLKEVVTSMNRGGC